MKRLYQYIFDNGCISVSTYDVYKETDEGYVYGNDGVGDCFTPKRDIGEIFAFDNFNRMFAYFTEESDAIFRERILCFLKSQREKFNLWIEEVMCANLKLEADDEH